MRLWYGCCSRIVLGEIMDEFHIHFIHIHRLVKKLSLKKGLLYEYDQ